MKQVEFFQHWNQEATSFPSSVSGRSESNSEANFDFYHKSDAWSQFTILQIIRNIAISSGRSLMYTSKSVESRMECWGTHERERDERDFFVKTPYSEPLEALYSWEKTR